MFKTDIKITGKHGYYVKALAPTKDQPDHSERIFARYIDVYMIGAVIGFIQNRKEESDTTSLNKESSYTATIFYNVIAGEEQRLKLIYRTIMLLEKSDELNEEERIDRAFKDDVLDDRNENKKKNDDLFECYVRGGISYLYEELYNGTFSLNDRIERIKKMVDEFYEEFYLESYLKDIEYEKDRII